MKTLAYGLAAALVLVGCHTITEELPTQPTKTPGSGILTVPIPKIPGATPTPNADAEAFADAHGRPDARADAHARGRREVRHPAAASRPQDEHQDPPQGSGPLHPRHHALSSRTPTTAGKVGFPDAQHLPGPAGGRRRTASRARRTRSATRSTRGGPGPTWYKERQAVHGQSNDCENHPDNQYLLWAYGDGYYQACTEDDVCGGVQVDR